TYCGVDQVGRILTGEIVHTGRDRSAIDGHGEEEHLPPPAFVHRGIAHHAANLHPAAVLAPARQIHVAGPLGNWITAFADRMHTAREHARGKHPRTADTGYFDLIARVYLRRIAAVDGDRPARILEEERVLPTGECRNDAAQAHGSGLGRLFGRESAHRGYPG